MLPMNFNDIREKDQEFVMQTYTRFPVDIQEGNNATLKSAEGRVYIDFSSGIGVNSVGTANPKWVDAVAAQAGKLAHISNLFYTQPCTNLAEILCRRSGLTSVFFSNSGAESNEGMIKVARKYSFDKYGKGRSTIITLNNSFHGRTMATLTATGQESFHNFFFPFVEGFRYADPTLDGIAQVAGHDVCAIMVELIQGEGGVYPMDKGFIQELAHLCAQRDWLLLVDEVQTGIGRTGSFFCYQQYDILPDVITFAKGIAGGLPLGGFMVGEKCAKVITAGLHGSTYGGNPICTSAALAVMEILDDNAIAEVNAKGKYLCDAIEAMNLPQLGETRGLGLMIGVSVNEGYNNKELAKTLIDNGLLILTAGPALRLLPPLTITKAEMDQGLAIMKQVLT